MSIPISCPTCRKTAMASEAAAGKSVVCSGCGTVIPVPALPMAVAVANEPASARHPSEVPARGEVSVWVWRVLEIGIFVAVCVIFAFIGASSDPDEPGLAASRMARKVGAPLALLLIGAVELVLWLRKSQRTKRDQTGQRS